MTASLRKAEALHPWLDALIAAPHDEVLALVSGYADIGSFSRAEPADAAASLFFRVPVEHPAVAALDSGCLSVLEEFRLTLIAGGGPARLVAVLVDRLFRVITRVRPERTIQDLRQRYLHWVGPFESQSVDAGLDLRREYWRLLSLTQDVAPSGQPRRLMPLWLNICAESGPRGQYDEAYLDAGLAGLANLPLGEQNDSNEEAVSHGLSQWALRQRPLRDDFLARWYEIEAAFPRSVSYWPPVISRVIASVETQLHEESGRPNASFPAASWWRDSHDIPPPSHKRRAADPQQSIAPPAKEEREIVLKDIRHNLQAITPRIARLMDRHVQYADLTGDVFYLVRTACNVGMRLLEAAPRNEAIGRGQLACDLARQTLAFAPSNPYAWSLWAKGLETQGAYAAAELVRWEAVQRFPENATARCQLADTLERLGRIDEAAELLEDTICSYPLDSVSRTELARIVAARDPERARELLTRAIEIHPKSPHPYALLARLLCSTFGEHQAAVELLDRFLEHDPGNKLRELREDVRAGRRIDPPTVFRPFEAPAVDFDIGVNLTAGAARRALFHAEASEGERRTKAPAEVRRLLGNDPGLAYISYVAERLGQGSGMGTSFAEAFARAVRENSIPQIIDLAKTSAGIPRLISRAALVLTGVEKAFDIPPAANDADEGASVHRFAKLAEMMKPALDVPVEQRRPYLRLLSDFAAMDLAIGLVA